jgi:hypothetical protein
MALFEQEVKEGPHGGLSRAKDQRKAGACSVFNNSESRARQYERVSTILFWAHFGAVAVSRVNSYRR